MKSDMFESVSLAIAHPEQFTQKARVEIKNDSTVYVYTPSGDKRYVLHQFPGTVVQRSLSLEGITRNGSWHTLMCVSHKSDEKTGASKGESIQVDVLNEGPAYSTITTPGRLAHYRSKENGRLHLGAHVGFFGTQQEIFAEVRALQPVALLASDLPPAIDIPATAQALVDTFVALEFVPPALVLPQGSLIMAPQK